MLYSYFKTRAENPRKSKNSGVEEDQNELLNILRTDNLDPICI